MTTDDASSGWDAFAEHGKVVFVRVNTEYDKGGRTSVKYAFKDDKPMFAKQQGGTFVSGLASTATNKANVRWHYSYMAPGSTAIGASGSWSATLGIVPS